MKPMLASDAVLEKIKYPIFVQPKIDGVRGINLNGVLTGRSLKPHANLFTTEFYSDPIYHGLDGELAAEKETHPSLCRITTSALNTIQGEPYTLWHCFDFVTEQVREQQYSVRYAILQNYVSSLHSRSLGLNLRVVPSIVVHNEAELLALETRFLEEGYEGVILRDPFGLYKSGRSTVREGGLLRIKVFESAEATVVSLEEGLTNHNPKEINALGQTERSTHKENMSPNGQVGCLICKAGNEGELFRVSPGRMTHQEREYFFRNPQEIIGKIITYQHFAKGVKDKPRFPTFQNFRAESDIGE
jgi:DNA ligase-1